MEKENNFLGTEIIEKPVSISEVNNEKGVIEYSLTIPQGSYLGKTLK